jgi:hypothetical protein
MAAQIEIALPVLDSLFCNRWATRMFLVAGQITMCEHMNVRDVSMSVCS